MRNVLLYGGGTQSTGLLLMCLDGEIKYDLDLTVFADTVNEPIFVYTYIQKVMDYVKEKYDYDIMFVSGGDLKKDVFDGIDEGKRFASLPLYTESDERDKRGNMKAGIINRQCTNEYKIIPINKAVKPLLGINRKSIANNSPIINRLFGMSLEELGRCKISTDWWAINKYPLVENRIYRHEVINWVNRNHTELKDPPRSSCYFCPFHSNEYWMLLKDKHPEIFELACEFDDKIRIQPKLNRKAYLHRSLVPLREIDFTKIVRSSMFTELIDECEGYCGI